MGKKLRAIPKFVSWEQEDEFWSTHDLTDLDLQEDSTPRDGTRRIRAREKDRGGQSDVDTPMETKDGIIITSEGLFLPTEYFRHMAKRLEVIVSAGQIVIRSSAKQTAQVNPRRRRVKDRRTKSSSRM